MKKFGLLPASAVAAIAACLISGQANAAPTCTTTITNPSTEPMATLNTTGTCVQFGDKLFGNFSLTSLIADGGANVVFSTNGDAHNIGFDSAGTYTQGSTPSFSYEVEVTSPNTTITAWSGDIDETTGNESTLTKGITPVGTGTGGTINCQVNGTAPPVACPETISVSLTDGAVAESEVTGTTAQVSAILDTITQTTVVPPPVPEPASLALLGSALAGLGFFGIRRRRQS